MFKRPCPVVTVNKLTHISGCLTVLVYLTKSLIEELFTNATVESIYFSDHDAERNIIEKNGIDF